MAARDVTAVAVAQDALSSPLFGAIEPWLSRLPRDRFPSVAELNCLVAPGTVTGGGRPLQFAAPVATRKNFDSLYEVRTFRCGEIATRESNWHDLFNALAWLAFPLTKAAINRQHHEALAERGSASGPRGTARDVLTVFDEGGVVVASADRGLTELLRAFRWKELFWARRTEVMARMRFFVFGHALFESALEPYKGIAAKALLLDVPAAFPGLAPRQQLAQVDARAADWFSSPDALRSTRALSPLPLLGVPGWSEGQDADFYDDADVFRPGYRAAR